ncbi:MAG: tetratricopeptide repeat protein [Planctomycetes bacterium]|nr:tetratricopeptide repeat protein [Planctomycetota bacterium]
MTQTIPSRVPAPAPLPASAAAVPTASGFQSIPTRIRDLRDTQVPPLVVEDQNKEAICQSLGELGIKLAEIHRTAGEAYLSQGLYDQALPHIEAAATFGSGDIEYRMQAGFIRYVTGDDIGAIDAFNAVIAAEPGNAEGWFNLGMVLFGQEQFAEAEDCFARSLAVEPGDAQTWNNRGVCLWKLGKPSDAKVCFERAITIDPNDQDAAFNLQNLA